MKLLLKKSGFTLLEVLFAVVILSFALSTIFVFLNSMFRTVKKIKNISYQIDRTPLVYSFDSFIVKNIKVNNYESEKFKIIFYSNTNLISENTLKNVKNIYSLEYVSDQNNVNEKKFGNMIFIPEEKKDEQKD